MKIVILGPAHPIRPGGMTTFNERLCKAFTDEGHDCSIWSYSLQYPSFLFPGTSQYTDGPAPEGIRIKTVLNSINPFNWYKTGRLLRDEKPDLVIVRYWIPFMGPCLGTVLRRVKKNKHTRIICIADNVIPHEHRFYDSMFTRYFVKPVDSFVVMSKQVLSDLRKFTQTNAKLVHHPLYDNFGEKVDKATARKFLAEKLSITLQDYSKWLLFFGLVRHYKGLDILLEAFALIEDKSIRLLVAGEFYENEEQYHRIIRKHGLDDRIILYNRFIENSDVRYVICAADGIIQPYRSATQSGVSPVAYHFEIPMIVTNVGGLPDIVPHRVAGLVTEPDAASIANSISDFFVLSPDCFLPGIHDMKKLLSWEKMVRTLIS